MDHLAALLLAHRKKAGLTQKQLSNKLHFNHTVISRTENRDSGYLPTQTYIDDFAAALQLTEPEIAELSQVYRAAVAEHSRGFQAVSPPTAQSETSLVDLAEDPPDRQGNKAESKCWWIFRQWRWFAAETVLIAITLAVIRIFWLTPQTNQPVIIAPASPSPTTNPSLPLPTPTTGPSIEIPPGTVLYTGDFQSNDRSDWEELNTGHWEIVNHGEDDMFGVHDQDPDAIPNAFLTPSLTWRNYSVSMNVVFQSGRFEQIYIIVRNAGRDENCTGYRVGGNRLGISIFRFDPKGGCAGELLAEDPHYPLTSDRTYQMRVDAQGSEIRYYIDDNLVLQATDPHYMQGGIGLEAYEVAWAYFDDVVVKSLGAER